MVTAVGEAAGVARVEYALDLPKEGKADLRKVIRSTIQSRPLDFRPDVIRCHSIVYLHHLCFAGPWTF